MAITALEIKDKTFGTKFRGYDIDEVDEFLDIIVRDFEDLVRSNHDKDAHIRNLEERLTYFDEMKDSLSQSVLIAQDTAEKVKLAANDQAHTVVRQAEQDSQRLLEDAKYKANEILRQATDNAKKVAVETEELKNKSRVFHQRLKSTIESQLAIVNSAEWEEILRPTATYLQTSDEAFKEVVQEALGEAVLTNEADAVDMTRQFSPEEMAELQERIAQANKELAETMSYQNLSHEVNEALEAGLIAEKEAELAQENSEEIVSSEPAKESINIL